MSNPQAMHWRRHDTFSSTDPPGDVITASACGRIVLNREATPDASEADCDACILVRDLMADWQTRTVAQTFLDAFRQENK
jgi:hypothetical protein